MSRFLHHAIVAGSLVATALAPRAAGSTAAPAGMAAVPPPTLGRLLGDARAGRWDTLTVGESLARFARAFEGAPYLEHTLDVPGPEVCRVSTRGFDCVTFVETCLALARTIRLDLGGRDPTDDDVRDAVAYTRYRAGHLDGYLSRLHYTAEWIADNETKGVIEDVTRSLGGVRYPVGVSFMSDHPALYPSLRSAPGGLEAMRRIERRIRAIPRTYVPRDRVAAIEPMLRTGDLVAITTSVEGLDYSHVGLIVRDDAGARLMHASSARGRVTLDEPIGRYLERGPKSNTGITVLRPVGR